MYEPLEINYPFQKYALYASGKHYANYISEGTCNDIDLKKYNKALLEISVYKNQMSINSFLLYASFLGYNIRDSLFANITNTLKVIMEIIHYA